MSENLIEKTLRENIKNLNTIFIFPTQTAADLWADRIITISDVHAVAMDRFIAWDNFKGKSIRSQHQDKTSIPSAMRDIFAEKLIQENGDHPFLNYLIIPEYAKNAAGFTKWISSLLPTLANWKNYFEKSGQEPDEQDKDLLKIYDSYKSFLDSYNFFDPAWETPPFKADGHHYFIFFPEILSDYFEYEQILRSSEDITIINLPKNLNSVDQTEEKPAVKFFNNSRIELKNVAEFVRKVHESNENPIDWTEIAISVPDIENYGAYLDRELTLYEIPHVMRNATPLSSTGAGALFQQLKDCSASSFTYNSLKTLLLNSDLPWKDKDAIKLLLKFGQENHCICSFYFDGQNIDVWEKSFKSLSNTSERESTFYHKLKHQITKITKAKTFAEIRDYYFEFRAEMFDMTLCTKKSDLILSRCISELASLLDLERDFLNKAQPPISIPSPFNFFVNYLNGVNYLEQTDELGVQIFPYKLSATAPFDCQIIVDASQAGLSVLYKQLSFLRDDKRKLLLKREDPNVTEQFVKLYQMHSIKTPVYFTAASKTFDGYAQTCSYLVEEDLRKCKDEKILFGDYPYISEKNWILDENLENFPEKITKIQKNGSNSWIFAQNFENFLENSTKAQALLLDRIHTKKPNFSKTQLDIFNTCPRAWIFEKVLYLEEEDNAAQLMDHFQMGNLYHKVFELYCKKLSHNKPDPLPIYITETGLTEEYKTILEDSINEAIEDKENAYLTKELLYTTKTALNKVIVNAIEEFSIIFNGCEILNNEGYFEYEDPEKNYKCNGRIDCLLKDKGTGETFLIDFKSSAGSIPENLYVNPDEPETLPNLQMPIYIYLMRNAEKPITVDNACYFNVKDGTCAYVFGQTLWEILELKDDQFVLPEDFEPTIQAAIKNMDEVANKIEQGDFSINPEVQNYSCCAGCAHNPICRRTFNVGKKD